MFVCLLPTSSRCDTLGKGNGGGGGGREQEEGRVIQTSTHVYSVPSFPARAPKEGVCVGGEYPNIV